MTEPSIDDFLGATPDRRWQRWLTVAALFVALVAAAILLDRFFNGGPALWYTAPLEQGDLDPVIAIDGTLYANDETVLNAPQDGVIDSVAGPDFSAVTPGESLVAFATDALQRQAAQARIAARAAQADFAQARLAQAETANRLARYEHVWQQSHGRVPARNEMEDARQAAARAAAAVDDADTRIASAQLQWTGARDQERSAFVRAAGAGFIVARHVAPGQFVHAGTPLMTLAGSLDRLLIRAGLASAQAMTLPRDTMAQVLVAALPGQTRSARLIRTEAGDGTVGQAVFALAGAAGPLRPAMPAELEFSLPTRRDVLLVPNSALMFSPAGSAHGKGTLYVVGPDGQARLIHVATGGTDGKQTEVQGAGLKIGQEVITGARPAASVGPLLGASR